MANHTINVTIIGGLPTCPDLHVMKGDTVNWTCADDYAIQFASGKSPFTPKMTFVSCAGGTPTPSYTVKKPPKNHTFKYSVFADVGGASPIVVQDPQIIIDDTGGGGGGPSKKKSKQGKKRTGKKSKKK